jgi:hypothetical protein
LKHDVKPIYTAVNADAARAALEELTEKWGGKYAAIIRLWNNAWKEFIPFLDYGACCRIPGGPALAERLRTRSAAVLGGLWDACGMTGRAPAQAQS